MSNFFENLKNLIFKKFKQDKKDLDVEKDHTRYSKTKIPEKPTVEKEADETSILMDEETRVKYDYDSYSNRKLLSTSLIQNKLLPLFYFIFSLSGIMFLISTENIINNPINYILLDRKQKKVLNFFMLYNLNPLIFHLFSLVCGLIGILIVLLVQKTIYIKNISFDKSVNQFSLLKIYLTSFFGLFSNFVHIISGMIYFFSSFAYINSYVEAELNMTIQEALFVLEVFFTCLYGIFVCIILNKLNKVDVLENERDNNLAYESFNYEKDNRNLLYEQNPSNMTHMNVLNIPENFEAKWLNYSIVCLIYLIFFSICYALMLLIKNNVISLANGNTDYFKLNQAYLLAFIPYFLFMLNTIFYSLFYGVLKYSSICHIEFTSHNIYDKSQKNML